MHASSPCEETLLLHRSRLYICVTNDLSQPTLTSPQSHDRLTPFDKKPSAYANPQYWTSTLGAYVAMVALAPWAWLIRMSRARRRIGMSARSSSTTHPTVPRSGGNERLQASNRPDHSAPAPGLERTGRITVSLMLLPLLDHRNNATLTRRQRSSHTRIGSPLHGRNISRRR